MATQPLHKDRKQYVTVEEAQIIINRSERTIRRWIKKKRVHVIRDASGYVRIDLDDLEQVREQQPLTIHPVQQRIQSYGSQIAAVEDRCAEHERQIEALQQQIHDLYDLLHTVLHSRPAGEEGEPATGRLLSLLATLNPTPALRKKELIQPELKRGYPLGTQRLVHFAKQHQIDSYQCKQLFQSREIQLTIYQRPGTIQRNKQEWWITPEQHQALANYCRHHEIAYIACEECREEATEVG